MGEADEVEKLRARCAALEAQVEASRENEELLTSLFDAVPDFIIRTTPTGALLFVNRVVPGLTMEQIRGTTVYDYVPPEWHGVLRSAFERAIATRGPTSYETAGMGAHGRLAKYFARLSPIIHDGAIESMVLVATDVTELAQAQEALHDSGEKLAIAVESTGVGIWSFRSDVDAATWDARTCSIFGVERAPESFEAYLELIHPADREMVRAHVARALQTGVFDDYEMRILRADGQVRWVMGKGRILLQEGGVAHLIGGIFDVTERHELQEQLLHAQKMEAVGQLAAGIAHNFNNMLTVMLSSMELAVRRVPEETSSLLASGQAAALRAAKMVRQLMLFAGKGRGGERRAEDLGALVRRTVDMCRTTFAHEIALLVDVREGLPPVRCDAGQVEQALLNVMINARDAVEAREEGPREIRVSVGESRQPTTGEGTRSLCITVKDSGIGMAEGVRQRVFEPFFTTKETGRGTGLGLATTYAILHDHGGTVECESVAGEGTAFHLHLPALTDVVSASQPESPRPGTLGKGERLLVVDDERMVCEVVARILTDAGYQVETAADGLEAVDRVRARVGELSLVLLDQSMPKLSGRAALRILRSVDPKIRVVCFTGQPTSIDDADAVLEKPVRAETLLATVREVLDRS